MSIVGAMLVTACGGSEISPPTIAPANIATATPTLVPPTPTPTLVPPTPTPTAIPIPAAAPIQVTSTGMQSNPLVPWYVPESHEAQYLTCLEHSDRFNRTDWILSKDWPRADAEYVADHEGGWDLCQFNTQGSGACGWFQILPCPPLGLTPEGQIAAAYAKWLDGGGSFERHWFRFWN